MNYYEVLGVSETATDKEIKKAYKGLVKKYHPDVFKGEKSLAETKIKEINEAYETLSDIVLRSEYDKSLFVPSFSDDDLDYSSDNSDVLKRYEDLYKYDYYKQRYTTNYYGVSRDDLRSNKVKVSSANSKVNDSDFILGSKSRFILVIGLGMVFLLIVLLWLLSYLGSLMSSNSNRTNMGSRYDVYNLPYIYFDMSFDEVKDLLGSPDSTENKNGLLYAYWGESYIIFNNDNLVSGWRNNGDFYTDTVTGEQSKKIFDLYNSLQSF